MNLTDKYSNKNLPLTGYAILMGGFHTLLFSYYYLGRKRLIAFSRLGLNDLLLLIIATHKLSRVITKDWVTSPLRAPFVEYKKSQGAGEVTEVSRGQGIQRAIGDLLTCPFCIGPWVASTLVFSFIMKPIPTRIVASIFTLVAGSDFLHLTYQTLRSRQQKIASN